MIESIETVLEVLLAIGSAYYIIKAGKENDRIIRIEYLLEACLSVLLIIL